MRSQKSYEKAFAAARTLPLFSSLTQRQMDYLFENAEVKILTPRQMAYQEGKVADHVFIVIYGGIKVLNKVDGQNVVYDFLPRGGLAGFLYFLNRERRFLFTGVALEHTALLAIPRQVYEALQKENNSFNQKTFELLNIFVQQLTRDHINATKKVPARVAGALVALYDRQQSESTTILFGLSKQDIAERVRAKAETVIRCCSAWEKMGIIETRGRTFEIKKVDELRKIAQAQD
ncbi:MAG: Crp/Fnr family transcriptional regulator [Bdellovibrionia bacterium]